MVQEAQKQFENKPNDTIAKYGYGVALIQTKDKENQSKGVKLLQGELVSEVL